MSTHGKTRERRRRQSFGWLLFTDLARSACMLLLLHALVFNFSLVRGSSMQPNIHDGDRLLVDKICYSVVGVSRFDVVILACPKNPQVDYVKRVIGLPGDHVHLESGRLWVNGVRVREPFARVLDVTDGTWTVPEDCYFVLGDNRPVSSDSREGWCVSRELIRGKVRACFWPLARVRVF